MVFMLVFECVFAMHSSEVVSSAEVAASSKVKDMELISYNVMLDFCLQFKRWAVSYQNMSDPGTLQNIDSNIGVWSTNVVKYVDSSGEQESLFIGISGLEIVTYSGQAYDRYQMGYLGVSGSEKWFVTGTLTVTVSCPWMTRVSNYNISIIC